MPLYTLYSGSVYTPVKVSDLAYLWAEPLFSLGPLTMSLVLSNLWAVKKVLQIHQRPRLLQVFTSAVLRDNPRYLYVYIPVSRKEKGGREVQATPFKDGSRKFHILLPFIFYWPELCHLAKPGASQAGQD